MDGYGRNADAWAVPPTAPFLHGPLAGLSVYPMERAYIKSPLVDVVPVESVLLVRFLMGQERRADASHYCAMCLNLPIHRMRNCGSSTIGYFHLMLGFSVNMVVLWLVPIDRKLHLPLGSLG